MVEDAKESNNKRIGNVRKYREEEKKEIVEVSSRKLDVSWHGGCAFRNKIYNSVAVYDSLWVDVIFRLCVSLFMIS